MAEAEAAAAEEVAVEEEEVPPARRDFIKSKVSNFRHALGKSPRQGPR